jgi:Glycosyl transferase family 2
MAAQQPVLAPQDSPGHPLAPWFADWRAERAARRRSSGPPPRRAVVTIVHDEPVFLPLWLAYYSRWFAPEDIYVLDNDTTDGSTHRGGFVRIPVSHDAVDHTWMLRTVQDLQHELLAAGYGVVLVCDVDEIIAPVPEWGTLGDYLDVFGDDWVNCLGYEILHMPSEPGIDLGRPVLDQRRHWFPNDAYDKAAIASVPMTWRTGFHGRADFHFNGDPDLRLVHLHRMDHDLCLQRHETRRRRAWAEEDTAKGWARHNRIVDPAEFDRWFYEDSSLELVPIRLEEIQPSWRGRF